MKNTQINNNADIIEAKLKGIPIDLIGTKILITGASGLIGVHLVEFFKKFSNNVYALTKNNPPSYMENIFERTKLIIGDVTDNNLLNSLPSDFEYIVHSAGYATPMKFMENTYETLKIGLITNFLLKKCIGQFLFISSSEVYSGSIRPEEDDPLQIDSNNPRMCYINAKLNGEMSVNTSDVDAKSVRVCNAYGPGIKMNDKRALNTFIQQALLTKEIRLRDYGRDVRDYCYIVDIVTKMLNVMFYGKSKLYNIGSEEEDSFITISDLAEKIAELTNSVVIYPKANENIIGSPKHSAVSMNKYNDEFGNYKSIPLIEGLQETIDWCDYLIQYKQEYYNFCGEVLS